MEEQNCNQESVNTDTSAKRQIHRPIFKGNATEYFRIWIVNTFLTILTLGIYTPWAKVRNRQYLYANTFIDGHNFDYLAKPFGLFKGYLILFVGLMLYIGSDFIKPGLGILVGFIGYCTIPYLIYKSLRFKAHNTSMRNIRMRFAGTLNRCFEVYLEYPIAVAITLGIATPWWAFEKKKYFFSNLCYGDKQASFYGTSKVFWGIYLKFAGLAILTMLAFGILTSLTMTPLLFGNPEQISLVDSIITALSFIPFAALIVLQQYLYARTNNYCWNYTKLGRITFKSNLRARDLIWIRFSNILAIIFSLGLLTPWAEIRRTRYLLDHLQLSSTEPLDTFAASIEAEETALGEAASDFFDLEFGL